MNSLRLTTIGGAIATGLGTVMFLTNPGQQGYEMYIERNIDIHLKKKVCAQASQQLGTWVQTQCHILVDTARPSLSQYVSQQTQRQNFILFSIYQTNLPIPPPYPDYHLETLGILGQFYTYQTDEL